MMTRTTATWLATCLLGVACSSDGDHPVQAPANDGGASSSIVGTGASTSMSTTTGAGGGGGAGGSDSSPGPCLDIVVWTDQGPAPCEVDLSGRLEGVDKATVQMVLDLFNAPNVALHGVESSSACLGDDAAFYFAGENVHFCPATCERVADTVVGKIIVTADCMDDG